MFSLKLGKFIQKRPISPRITTIQSVQLCDKKSSNDQNKKEEIPEKKSGSAAEKLNKLLASMKTDENDVLLKSVKIPKAGGRRKGKIEDQKKIEERKREQKSKDIIEAAKDVANLMKEDKQKVESELLAKLLNHTDINQVTTESSSDPHNKTEKVDLKNIISGMKVDNETERDQSRAQYVRKMIQNQKQKQQFSGSKQFRPQYTRTTGGSNQTITGSVNLFGEEPLGIFSKNTNMLKESVDCLRIWQKLEEKEMKLAITHPPANYFEKMILWTEQGKLWRFPINNEQGLEDQEKVDFSEHVFLEQHLESWCPKKGPIRHFMELVCVGLSKNPYISAQEKKEHILWYRDYFEQKKDLLKEIIIQQSDDKKDAKSLKH